MAKTPIPPSASLQSRRPLEKQYEAIIAIPSCDESDSLPMTLMSLEKTDPSHRNRTLVIVNVNQRRSMDRRDNLTTLDFLQGWDTPLTLAWLDHVTGDAAYPEKFGVGLARDQACRAGMPFVEDSSPIISLDADSPVNPGYLSAIFEYLEQNPDFRAGHVNFKHRHCCGDSEQNAIQVYERHLHQHRLRLEQAGSPHAWYAIGSTILCTKSAYLQAGGYHCRRMAGEDFYLLQQLSKTGSQIHFIENAYVYPSDRASNRVPFGTGRAVGEIINSGHWASYHPQCYLDLGRMLSVVESHWGDTAETILRQVPLGCREWLQQRDFVSVWPKLQANARDHAMLQAKFHEWNDAFQTLKLIHYLSDHHHRRVELHVS